MVNGTTQSSHDDKNFNNLFFYKPLVFQSSLNRSFALILDCIARILGMTGSRKTDFP